MGQDNSKKEVKGKQVPLGHPRFAHARLLNDKQHHEPYIEISQPVIDEGHVKTWEKQYKPLANSSSLLMPRSHSFSKTTLCGSSGLCTVSEGQGR